MAHHYKQSRSIVDTISGDRHHILTFQDSNKPMQVNIEQLDGLKRRLQITVPATDIDHKMQSRLQELGKSIRLKGFRPGRVPPQVVRQRYGKQVRDEIMQDVMRDGLNNAIADNKLRVAALREITPAVGDDAKSDLQFTAELELYPELQALDLNALDLTKPEVEVTDADVDDMLTTLQEQRREWQAVDEPAASNHRVAIAFVATLDDQRIPEHGHERISVLLGSGMLFAAFDEAIHGMTVGEKKSLELSFPDSFRHEQLAGQTAQVEFTLDQVETGELPPVDDAFAEAFGIDEGVERLREEVKANLDRERRGAINRLERMHLSDELAKIYADITLPESLIEQEIEQLQQRMRQEIKQSGGDESMLPPREQLQAAAERRVRDSVILAELAVQNDIQLDQQRVQQAIVDIASTYEQPEQVVELYSSNQQLLENLSQSVLEDQVIDWIIEQADSKPEPMALPELMQRVNQQTGQ